MPPAAVGRSKKRKGNRKLSRLIAEPLSWLSAVSSDKYDPWQSSSGCVTEVQCPMIFRLPRRITAQLLSCQQVYAYSVLHMFDIHKYTRTRIYKYNVENNVSKQKTHSSGKSYRVVMCLDLLLREKHAVKCPTRYGVAAYVELEPSSVTDIIYACMHACTYVNLICKYNIIFASNSLTRFT